MESSVKCALFVLIQLLTLFVQSKPAPSRLPVIPSIDQMNFMQKYGYLGGDPSSNFAAQYTEDSIVEAIQNIQKFGGIKQTGVLDNKTIQLMSKPRCGVQDVVRGNRTKRFTIAGRGWQKRELTYFVGNWNGNLGERPVKDAIKKALNMWAPYGKLTFIPSNNPSSDLKISFGAGNHGDQYPFDGPGYVLAHAFFPYVQNGGSVHFDNEESWTLNKNNEDEEGTDFFSVAVHELGHALGLGHSTVPESIMFAYYKGGPLQLDYDDVLAMYELYIKQLGYEEPKREKSERGETERPTPTKAPTVRPTKVSTERPTKATTKRPTKATTKRPTKATTIRPTNAPTKRPTTQTTSTKVSTERPTITTTKRPTKATTIRPTNAPTTKRPTTQTTSTTVRTGYTYDGDYKSVDDHKTHTGTHRKNTSELCRGDYDTIAVIKRELFVFKGKNVWKFQKKGLLYDGFPKTLTAMFPGLPESIEKIDAVYENSYNQVTFFSGSSHWILNGDHMGGPFSLEEYEIYNYSKLNAVFLWPKNNKTYLFGSDKFWRYNEMKGTLDNNYPKHMGRWKGIPENINSVINWIDDSTYFFKGLFYWRFNNDLVEVDKHYPLPVPQQWFGCLETPRVIQELRKLKKKKTIPKVRGVK